MVLIAIVSCVGAWLTLVSCCRLYGTNNINPINPSHGHDDPRVREGRMLRHALTTRDRSVFDRNMAMMRALEAGEPVTCVWATWVPHCGH